MSFRNLERGDSPERNAESPEKSAKERADANEDKKLTSRIKDFFNPDKKKETKEEKGDGEKEEKEVKSQILKTPETLSEKEKSKVKVERLDEGDKKSDAEKKTDVEKENLDKKGENVSEEKTEKSSPFKNILDKFKKKEEKPEKTEEKENKSDVRTPTRRDPKFEAYLQELRDKTEAYQKSDAYKKDQEAREKKKLEKKEETDGDNEDYQRERTLEPNNHGWDRYKENTKNKDDGLEL